MDIVDFILFPIYMMLAYSYIRFRQKRITDPVLSRYFIYGFWVKMAGCIAFTLFNTYLSPGDSIAVYQAEGQHIYRQITADPSNIKLLFTHAEHYDESLLFDHHNTGTLKSESNFWTVRITAIFSFISFGKYFVNNLLFALLSYAGMWRLFKFFYEQKPYLHKRLAIAVLYIPTVVFWSAGAMKDPVCISGLGFITYALYGIFIKRERLIGNSVIIFAAGYILAVIKVYILIAYLPFLVIFLLLKNVTLMKNKFAKYVMGLLLIAGCIYMFTELASTLDKDLGNYAVSNIAESVKTQQQNFEAQQESGSNFSLGVDFDGSSIGIAALAPAAVVATLFRPFLWESKKPSTVLSSLESLALMFFTLYVMYKAGISVFFRSLFKDPLVMYCFFFAIVFAVFVGATTLNFGSLVRYKIPCLPFYLITLFLILDKAHQKAVKTVPAV